MSVWNEVNNDPINALHVKGPNKKPNILKQTFGQVKKSVGNVVQGIGQGVTNLITPPNLANAALKVGSLVNNALMTDMVSRDVGSGSKKLMAVNNTLKKGIKTIFGDNNPLSNVGEGLVDVATLLPATFNKLYSTKLVGMDSDYLGVVNKTSGYSDSSADITKASELSGETVGGLSRLSGGASRRNDFIQEQKAAAQEIGRVLGQAELDKYASESPMNALRTNLNLGGGFSFTAKKGIKFKSRKEAQKILKNRKSKQTTKFKEGGSFNIIPEGALHKNRHHLEDIDEKFSDLTTKGIPVVSEAEGGELVQQAEVEHSEIIFRLEVTKKLEELAKEGTDEAAIEAGKLLVDEILYNTVDKVGLLND